MIQAKLITEPIVNVTSLLKSSEAPDAGGLRK